MMLSAGIKLVIPGGYIMNIIAWLALLGATPMAVAQTALPVTVEPVVTGAVVAKPVTVAAKGGVLPAKTEVMLTLNQEVSSRKMKEGQQFDVSVSRDVMMGAYIVIPRGTRGRGEIT